MPFTAMPKIRISYKTIARKFLSQNPSLKTRKIKYKYIDGKYLIHALYEYIINSNDKETEHIKNMFIKYNITAQYMEKTIRKMFKELEKNILINNITFVPGFGFYGFRILKNQNRFYIWHVYLEHYTKNGKIKPKSVMIIPQYSLYAKAYHNLCYNPIYR